MDIVKIAESFLSVRETQGKNRSTQIDAFNHFTGAPMGSPWCASFVSYCLNKAGAGNNGFRIASTTQIKGWARLKSRFFKDPKELAKCHGALFGWTGPDGVHGHVGIVTERLTDANGEIVAIGTIEGNTNEAGSRDGDGVYKKKRTIHADDLAHEYWFVDMSGIPGCDYWK